MNRGLTILAVVASLGLLAGCTISGGGGGNGGGDPFPGEDIETVSVQPDFESDPVSDNEFLGSGDSQLYRVNISDTVAQENDLVYFDAVPEGSGDNLRVTVYEVSGSSATPLYASTSNQWFGLPNDPGLSSTAVDFQTSSVDVAGGTCGGPCVIVNTPSGGGTGYVRVEAVGGSASYDFYVVGDDHADVGEPNDTFANAETTDASLSISGALETIGDEDWYRPSRDVVGVELSAPPEDADLRLRANIYREDGGYLETIAEGEEYILPVSLSAQRIRVEVFSQDSQPRAASAGRAIYFVDFIEFD